MTIRCLSGTWVYCTCVIIVASIVAVLLLAENQQWRSTPLPPHDSQSRASSIPVGRRRRLTVNRNLEINCTHAKNKLLETVEVEYERNIFFTVKTTANYYKDRLPVLLLTWFQTLHKNDMAIITDDLEVGKPYVSVLKGVGLNLIISDCPSGHERPALCCKTGYEFATYYAVSESNKRYQWFCHVDDDVYVNVPRLSEVLQQYDPRQPHYVGRWIRDVASVQVSDRRRKIIKQNNITLKMNHFQYAAGATYCISHALMTLAQNYFSNKDAFCKYANIVLYGDDVAIGFIIHVFLGYHLTNDEYFINQHDKSTNATSLQEYVTVSYKQEGHRLSHVLNIRNTFPEDQTKFMSYHCLLFPKVSWCKRHKKRKNINV